jgi:hypothetical protein
MCAGEQGSRRKGVVGERELALRLIATPKRRPGGTTTQTRTEQSQMEETHAVHEEILVGALAN